MDKISSFIPPDSGIQFVYRISYSTPVAPIIAVRIARIQIRNDTSVEIIAKTKDTYGNTRTLRSLKLTEGDAGRLLSLLRWEEFFKLDSLSHIPPNLTRAIKDGNHCTLEGTSGSEFNEVHRVQLQQDSPLDPAKTFLFGVYGFLSNLGIWKTQ
jgi:hypothetical protein